MPTTICFINKKGGVGKSSLCFHLAGAFATSGMRVLVLDIDPQGSISNVFLGPTVAEHLPLEETTALLFSESGFFADHSGMIRPTPFEGIDLCPANKHLDRFNTPCPEQLGVDQALLSEFLLEHAQGYDLVLIDCPPNLYRCSWTAMVASDYVIVPVPPEDFATQGIRAVHEAIESARVLNPSLRRLGHVITMSVEKLLIHKHFDGRLRSIHRGEVFDTAIKELVGFKMAIAARKPVEYLDPKSLAAELTRQLSREVLSRIAAKQSRRRVA